MDVGKKYRVEQKVEYKDTASSYGSGLLEVFSTPAMIALMEKSAHLLAKSILPENIDTVGTEVDIKHTRATPIGALVTSEAELISFEDRKLVFKVFAFDEKGEIGYGKHIRYTIDPVKFMNKLN